MRFPRRALRATLTITKQEKPRQRFSGTNILASPRSSPVLRFCNPAFFRGEGQRYHAINARHWLRVNGTSRPFVEGRTLCAARLLLVSLDTIPGTQQCVC